MMKRVLTLGLASGLLMACDAGENQTNVELIQDMMDQPSLKAQDYDLGSGQVANRLPPENTVPMNREYYPYWTDPIAAGRNLRNPIAGDNTTLERGQAQYNVYCALCHGLTGGGEGQIAEYMALKPPSLLTSKIQNYPDGRIFHIVTAGQGVMGNYATQIFDSKDRWAIVNYVRKLQKDKGGN